MARGVLVVGTSPPLTLQRSKVDVLVFNRNLWSE